MITVKTETENDDREALADAIALGVLAASDGSVRLHEQHARETADAVLAAGFRRHPEGATVTEWGVEYGANGVEPEPRGEEPARRWLGMTKYPGARLVSRQRTSYADVVTEWVAVDE